MSVNGQNTIKNRGDSDVSYLGHSVDDMISAFMKENDIPGLALAIVQAPYITRVVGYGLSDIEQKRLSADNTMWPAGPISQGYAAVAVMQLYEAGIIDIHDPIEEYMPELPEALRGISILDFLRHDSGIPGRAEDFRLLSELIERVSGMSYHDFITKYQIDYLGLRHTGFAEDIPSFPHEDISKTGGLYEQFKKLADYIDPTEPAVGYGADGKRVTYENAAGEKGYSDIWASARDISLWDIALAGSILIKSPENRDLIYKPWRKPNGELVPAVAGWQFYNHPGLMDIKGSIPGFSSYLSRFTDASELVCVTLLANKEGIDFTNLARKIAAAFGGKMATGYDDNKLYLLESQFSAAETVNRLKRELNNRNLPIFAEYDHSKNAEDAGLSLRPTDVVVFGSPAVGTGLMQKDQSASLDLPLKISVWQDESGSVWLGFPKMDETVSFNGQANDPTLAKMESLLEELGHKATSYY